MKFLWYGMEGMSFHGGLIGVVIRYTNFFKKNMKLDHFIFLDLVAFICSYWNFLWKNSKFYKWSELYGKSHQILPWSVEVYS